MIGEEPSAGPLPGRKGGSRVPGRILAEVVATASCVGARTVALVASAGPDGLTERDVVRALADLEVRVAEVPWLPAEPPSGIPPTLPDQVERLRLRLSIQLPFGDALRSGFRVLDGFVLEDGRILDAAALDEGRRRVEMMPDRAVAGSVLSCLRAVATDRRRTDDLVLWEIVHLLRGLRAEGFGHRELTTQAALLGLVHSDAEVLAAALVEQDSTALVERLRLLPRPVPAPSTVVVPPSPPDTVPPIHDEPGWRAAEADLPLVPGTSTVVFEPELAVSHGRPGMLTITWTTPPGADVVLRRATHPPAAHRGDMVDVAAVWRHGVTEPTAGASAAGGGRMSREIPIPTDAAHVTIYAIRDQMAVVGDTVALSEAQPVRDLQVDRFGRQAVLGWGWPAGAVAALVTWAPSTTPTGAANSREIRCTPRDLERGLRIDVGHHGATFAVRAVYGYLDNQVLSPPVGCELAAMGVPLRYSIVRRRWSLGRRRRSERADAHWHFDVLVTVDDACLLPDLVVIESRSENRPTKVGGGQIVGRLHGRRAEAGEVLAIPVDLTTSGPSWLVCFVDPATTHGRDEVVIEDPPESESRRR
jgi:hypothetical protein